MSGADVLSVTAGVILVVGSLFFLVTAVGMLRARDAISRVNNLSPATGVGLPLVIVGAALGDLARSELGVVDGVMAVLAIIAALVVSSVASNMLGRAAYRSQLELDPRTISNALGPHEDLPDHAHDDGHHHGHRHGPGRGADHQPGTTTPSDDGK